MTYMPAFLTTNISKPLENPSQAEVSLLREYSQQGLTRRIQAHQLTADTHRYEARLASELDVLEQAGCCGYFLIVADYVLWAKDNGIAVGPGRGSGPCSLTAFALGITDIDPIQHSLPFERFMNPEVCPVPDFDIEFCAQRSGEVVSYLQQKYGTDRVAQISTDNSPLLPARLVIGDRPLTDLVTISPDPASGFPATGLTVSQIAEAGLVKFNVIGQGALSVIDRTVKHLANNGVHIHLSNLDIDNRATYQLLCKGEPSNIDILDGSSYQHALTTIQPQQFEQLRDAVTLSQPCMQRFINDYLQRKQQPESIDYLHPLLKSVTASTYGLILYQEQLMHIAQRVAGFSLTQGDLLRRALQKDNQKSISLHRQRFIHGAVKRTLSPAEADTIFDSVSARAQHLFNQSHAIALAVIAYQGAWLKANHRQEYLHAGAGH